MQMNNFPVWNEQMVWIKGSKLQGPWNPWSFVLEIRKLGAIDHIMSIWVTKQNFWSDVIPRLKKEEEHGISSLFIL